MPFEASLFCGVRPTRSPPLMDGPELTQRKFAGICVTYYYMSMSSPISTR